MHHNESGLNFIPGIGIINNTGMNLTVEGVYMNGTNLHVQSSPIPDGYLAPIDFSGPAEYATVRRKSNILIEVFFSVATANSSSTFGYGTIRYQGPNYFPVYGPPLPP
jgi:hypothetical protein